MQDRLVTPSPSIRDALAGWFVVLLLAAALAIGPLVLGERKQAAAGPEVLPPTHWTLLHARAAIPPRDDETTTAAETVQETYRTVGAGSRIGDLPSPVAETTVAAMAAAK
jgi:hypothetical protein